MVTADLRAQIVSCAITLREAGSFQSLSVFEMKLYLYASSKWTLKQDLKWYPFTGRLILQTVAFLLFTDFYEDFNTFDGTVTTMQTHTLYLSGYLIITRGFLSTK